MATPVDGRRFLDSGDSGSREDGRRKKPKTNAATGASAAGIRAVSIQFMSFWFRAPIKAFFRSRIDYMGYARAINPRVQANMPWSWRSTAPAVLAHAVRLQGWSFIPNQVLPPMLANVSVGAILYTSYLQTLGALHEPSSHANKRVYPPPPPQQTFAAGMIAGSIQSLFAAPLDALQVRFQTSEMLEGKYKTMWQYAGHKLREIGVRGVFAGWSLSLLKDSFGSGVFFATFEYIKSQAYYGFVTKYYGKYEPTFHWHPYKSTIRYENGDGRPTIRPHYMMEPSFILLAGIAASVFQQGIQYPLTEVQNVHYGRLESIDYASHQETKQPRGMLRMYYRAYEETYKQCRMQAKRLGGWRAWLYKDFFMNTIRQVPSTSAGLIVFEVVRRKYGNDSDAVRIEKDGYDILLT
ncbi:putative mitochondrial carrier protein [Saccharata proteae CBS 121410]|uniref:Mitochondrial carrier protein n=1 Tax=Saccharata proteae CBS 121410 TaxID=1314787 RepID=A0A9P4M1R1_9PEZI|nr:putative mitochondrial carrier protein [Saccharata proteae CBS 121410]